MKAEWMTRVVVTAVAAVGLAALVGRAAVGPFPDPAMDAERGAKGKQTAVFAGGCFWCTEVVFEQLSGVEKVVSGYAGGDPKMAKYDLVSAGRTDHTESIQVTYDPSKITYGQLLKVFFSVAHDPTQKDRQGPDSGRQYRSAIFAVDAEQRRVAEAYMKQLGDAKVFGKPIVTEIGDLKGFYPAEGYHQDFVRRNPDHPYVVVNAVPKVKKVRKEFASLVR